MNAPDTTVTSGRRGSFARPGEGKARILYADDDADMREYVLDLLRQDYEVEVAADGEAAWESARACLPDLVLADLRMPRLDGLGLLHKLRAEPALRAIPVILLSARAGEGGSCVDGLVAGANDFLVKPFRAGELRARIGGQLEMARVRRAAEAAQQRAQAMEITERKQVEDDLRQIQKDEHARRIELEILMETAPALVWIARDPECRFITGNRAAHELLRAPVGSNLSKSAPEAERLRHFQARRNNQIIPNEDLPMQLAGRTGQPVLDAELEIRFTDGSSRWIYGNAVPLRNEAGAVRGVIATFIDITEHKQAEQELARAQENLKKHAHDLELLVSERTAELRETLQTLEGFSYHIAHDLRGPLRAIQGFSAVLISDHSAGIDEAGKDLLKRITLSGARLQQLIEDLLEYGRLSHQELPLGPVDLNALFNSLAAHLAEEIKSKGASIQLSPPFPSVRANKILLEQIFINLMVNAWTYVARGVAPRLQIQARTSPSTVQISFQDNGIGIDPEYHERIFRPFERLHTVKSYPGTGIGLAIVQKGIQRLGGRVWVESQPGQGSCFVVELPHASAEPSPGRQSGETSNQGMETA